MGLPRGRTQKLQRKLADERIICLLSTTTMTFKQIVAQMLQENMKASLNDIRRVNKNNRYRKKRYDSKLNQQQRKSLVHELLDPIKPNLTALAEKYGICHGSVWYWCDKVECVRIRYKGLIPAKHPILEGITTEPETTDFMFTDDSAVSGLSATGNNSPNSDGEYRMDVALISGQTPDDWDDDQIDQREEEVVVDVEAVSEEEFPLNLSADGPHAGTSGSSLVNAECMQVDNKSPSHQQVIDYSSLQLVGPVQVLNLLGQLMSLPIMMYTQQQSIMQQQQAAATAIAWATSGEQGLPIDATIKPANRMQQSDTFAPLCLKKMRRQFDN